MADSVAASAAVVVVGGDLEGEGRDGKVRVARVSEKEDKGGKGRRVITQGGSSLRQRRRVPCK